MMSGAFHYEGKIELGGMERQKDEGHSKTVVREERSDALIP